MRPDREDLHNARRALRMWWRYQDLPALDYIWMQPDNKYWNLDEAPWAFVWALLCVAMFVLSVASA